MAVVLGSGGAFLKAPAPNSRHILVMGASNETAWGAESSLVPPADCPGPTVDDNLGYQNRNVGWHQVAADAVGADVHNISFAGCALQAANTGGFGTQTFPVLFTESNSADTNSTWDPNLWVPDVVFLNLGPSDYVANALNDQFDAAYVAFVEHLIDLYPHARFYLFLGSLYDGDQRVQLRTHDMAVASTLLANGHPQVSFLELPQDTGTTFGCGHHADKVLHYAQAQLIIVRLRADMNW